MTLPFFNKTVVSAETKLPEAYIIPVEYADIAERMRLHGIKMDILTTEVEINVNSYRFKNYEFHKTPYEGRLMVNSSLAEIKENRIFPAGSFVVRTDQRTARIIAAILEPASSGSYFEWGFFNAILEQKEYSETYVMETMAREMLNKDPELKKEYEQKLKDSSFSKSQEDILNWFYSQTPYWDNRYNIYPIGKIYDAATLNKIRSISAHFEE